LGEKIAVIREPPKRFARLEWVSGVHDKAVVPINHVLLVAGYVGGDGGPAAMEHLERS
jgi:hypothetical protein